MSSMRAAQGLCQNAWWNSLSESLILPMPSNLNHEQWARKQSSISNDPVIIIERFKYTCNTPNMFFLIIPFWACCFLLCRTTWAMCFYDMSSLHWFSEWMGCSHCTACCKQFSGVSAPWDGEEGAREREEEVEDWVTGFGGGLDRNEMIGWWAH